MKSLIKKVKQEQWTNPNNVLILHCFTNSMSKTKFTKEHYIQWFKTMMQTRRFEEKSAQMYGQQKIKGFCHLYIGQEALTAGMMTAITKEDSVITADRDHGHALAMGSTSNEGMAEQFGKATGVTKGKGFQGVIKRWGFSGGRATHGSKFHRAPGSIGMSASPARVHRGKKMPGQMGNARVTQQNLEIVEVRADQNLILVKGAIPGPNQGLVLIRKCVKA